MKQDLWEQGWTITEVVEQLLGWGNGSGEEFMEWLSDFRLEPQKAEEVYAYLDLVVKAEAYRRAKGLIE